MSTGTSATDSIRGLVEAQVAAWNAGDADGWARDFVDDSAFVNILGMRFEGREANANRHRQMFDTVFRGSRLELKELKVRLLGDGAAAADAVLDQTHFRSLPPGIRPSIGDDVLRTRMHYVLVREGGRWWIVFSQNTAVMPMAPPR